jgi:lipoic acid synthetase
MNSDHEKRPRLLKPPWLRRRIQAGASCQEIHRILKTSNLHTVCQEARCPNLGECFSRGTTTFLILGDRCTRNCRFCAVTHGQPGPPDPGEPARIAEAAQSMELRYVVITSVTRDDLPDGGASFFAETIKEIRKRMPEALVEVLIPDFQGNIDALHAVIKDHPDVLNHNLETVPRLYASVRPGAVYSRSLKLLRKAKNFDPTIPTKSGLMLGLGEFPEEVEKTLEDLLYVGCSILTLGQYLQPTQKHLQVERFIHPEKFDSWRERALKMGFSKVASGPFVRSSYNARELYQAVKL